MNTTLTKWKDRFATDKRLRWGALAVLIVVPVLGVIWYAASSGPLPKMTSFRSSTFSFEYPRVAVLREYAPEIVTLGSNESGSFQPLVDVIIYRNDPDVPPPPSFESFVERQAQALCGSDAVEDVTCSDPLVEPYTSLLGYEGLLLSLTITRTNLETGAIETADYAPLYVFDTTPQFDPDEERHYEALFIHHALPAMLGGVISPTLLDQVIGSLVINEQDAQ